MTIENARLMLLTIEAEIDRERAKLPDDPSAMDRFHYRRAVAPLEFRREQIRNALDNGYNITCPTIVSAQPAS